MTCEGCQAKGDDWRIMQQRYTWVGFKVVGTFGPSRMGGPMSTHTCPSGSSEGCTNPAGAQSSAEVLHSFMHSSIAICSQASCPHIHRHSCMAKACDKRS